MFGINQEELIELMKDLSEEEQVVGSDQSNIEISPEILKTFSSEKICSLIASNRYLRFSDSLEVLAMQELAQRRIDGDNFEFENLIKEYSSTFVPINIKLPDLMKIAAEYRKK